MELNHLQRWSRPSNYFGAEWPEYYRAGVGQSRDSDDLEASNFAAMLKDLGGESVSVFVVRESHWAVGWVEWIAIHESNEKALGVADANMERLEQYPVLDEDDWSEREDEHANQIWTECYSVEERVKYIREHRSQFEFRDWADMRGCVRGLYFAGYASELIG